MTQPEGPLSDYVAGLEVGAIPAPTLDRVRQLVLDAVACGLAGVNAELRPEVESVAQTMFGAGSSPVIGGPPRAPGGAALLNGFQIAAPTLGDVHRRTLTHVLPEVLPAGLAAAEIHRATGADLLAGLTAGIEVTVRVAQALHSDAYESRAWHNPGIAGAVGAACAAARVANMDARGVRVAIGHAASQAAGTFAALGTSGVKMHQARGGLSGLLSAELAAGGVDASERGLTAARGGLLAAYADGGRPECLTDGLGSEYMLGSIALRRWPGASSLQPVIEATLLLRAELRLSVGSRDLEEITDLRVELPPRAFALNGAAGWATRLSALQSARWTVAVALTDGDVWLDQAADARRADAAVGRLAESVIVTQDSTLPPTGARVTLRDGAGLERTEQVDIPSGDERRPLTQEEIRHKLDRAASSAGLEARVESILSSINTLESASSIDGLTRALEVR